MNDLFLAGKISVPVGDKGFVKILPVSDDPGRFLKLRKIFVDFFGDTKTFVIDDVKIVKGQVQIKFKNFDSAGDVAVLNGKDFFVNEEDLPELPENFFFIHDLIGSIVLRNNYEFGKVKDFLTLPANNVYVIETLDGKEVLVPAISEYVEDFFPEKKLLILKPGTDIYEEDDD